MLLEQYLLSLKAAKPTVRTIVIVLSWKEDLTDINLQRNSIACIRLY